MVEALDPVVPCALWAMDDSPGVRPVCRHPDLALTPDLTRYERPKLYILNLGHSWLAERCCLKRRPRPIGHGAWRPRHGGTPCAWR